MPETSTEIKDKTPSLSEPYHRARKNLGIFGALLIAWELIGIELTEAPISNFKVKFESPQAAPYVLIVLTLYFMYRLLIEWRLHHSSIRKLKPALIDFTVSESIGFLALALYFFQKFYGVQIANKPNIIVMIVSAVAGMIIGTLPRSIFVLSMHWETIRNQGLPYIIIFSLGILAFPLFGIAIVVITDITGYSNMYSLISTVIPMILVGGFLIFVYKLMGGTD